MKILNILSLVFMFASVAQASENSYRIEGDWVVQRSYCTQDSLAMTCGDDAPVKVTIRVVDLQGQIMEYVAEDGQGQITTLILENVGTPGQGAVDYKDFSLTDLAYRYEEVSHQNGVSEIQMTGEAYRENRLRLYRSEYTPIDNIDTTRTLTLERVQ